MVFGIIWNGQLIMLPLETVCSPSPRHCNYVLSGRLSRPRVLGNFLLSFIPAAPTNVPIGREFKTSMLGKKERSTQAMINTRPGCSVEEQKYPPLRGTGPR